MSVLAFIVALFAIAAFAVEVVITRARSATAWGLLALTVALVIQFVHPVADVVVR